MTPTCPECGTVTFSVGPPLEEMLIADVEWERECKEDAMAEANRLRVRVKHLEEQVATEKRWYQKASKEVIKLHNTLGEVTRLFDELQEAYED